MEIINVINLDVGQKAESMNPDISEDFIRRSREERVLSICKQSKEQGFAVRFWEGIIDERGGFAGINLSFKKIVRWAKEQGFVKVIIAEDDCVFSAPGAWQYYLDQMPEVFDIYSGGVYSGQIEGNRIMNGFSGNTLITVHERFYDFFLFITENDHCDRQLGNFCFEKMYIVCQPFVVTQLHGYSDNTRNNTTHKDYKEGKLFKGLGSL